MRTPIEPHHAELITALDDAWLSHAMRRDTTPDGVKVLPPVSQHPLSAALFDVAAG